MAEEDRPTRGARSLRLALVGLALLVRLLHLAHVEPSPIFDYHRSFRESDMYMFDQWARRIVGGDVLGRQVYHPLNGWQTAAAPAESWNLWYGAEPTFYKAPLYPYGIAALYALFGDAMLPLALLQIAAAGLSVWVLFGMTERLLGARPAFFASLLLAVYAPAIHFDVLMLRGPWIVLLSLLATRQLIEVRRTGSPRRGVALGLLLGASILVNEAFVTALPMALLALEPWRPLRWRPCLAALAGTAASLTPLVLRNVVVGAPPLKLAVTGSTVYAVFNSAASSPYFFEARAAAFVPVMAESGASLGRTVVACFRTFPGPVAAVLFYLKKASGLVIPFENPDNVNIYYAALKDPLLALLPGYALLFPLAVVGLCWAARRWRDLVPLAPYSLSLLFSILVALPLSRYRATLAVFMMPLAGVALARSWELARSRALTRLGMVAASVAAIAFAGATWQSRVTFGGRPAGLFLYRAPEFLLGAESYAARGRYGAALDEIVALLRHNPDRSVRPAALLLAARVHVDQGRPESAREDLDLAIREAGPDPGVLMAVGDFRRNAFHDETGARELYLRALGLAAQGATRDALLVRLGAPEAPR